MSNFPLGTVLYSTNLDMSQNAPVGLCNHLAIWVGNNQIIEAQKDMDGKSGVLLTPFDDYKKRKLEYNVLFPKDKHIGEMAADFARTLIGRKYGKFSSFRHLREHARRLNCTALVALCYSHALGKEIRLTVPDEIFKRDDIFTDKLPT